MGHCSSVATERLTDPITLEPIEPKEAIKLNVWIKTKRGLKTHTFVFDATSLYNYLFHCAREWGRPIQNVYTNTSFTNSELHRVIQLLNQHFQWRKKAIKAFDQFVRGIEKHFLFKISKRQPDYAEENNEAYIQSFWIEKTKWKRFKTLQKIRIRAFTEAPFLGFQLDHSHLQMFLHMFGPQRTDHAIQYSTLTHEDLPILASSYRKAPFLTLKVKEFSVREHFDWVVEASLFSYSPLFLSKQTLSPEDFQTYIKVFARRFLVPKEIEYSFHTFLQTFCAFESFDAYRFLVCSSKLEGLHLSKATFRKRAMTLDSLTFHDFEYIKKVFDESKYRWTI